MCSISNSSFTVTLEQQRSNKVCVFRACLSGFEVSQLSSEFLVQIREVFKLTSPSMNHYLLKSYFSFYCSARSPLWARTFLCQIYTSPDQTNWQFCRDNGLQPPITHHAPHRFINALSKSHGVYNPALLCLLFCVSHEVFMLHCVVRDVSYSLSYCRKLTLREINANR